jgi:hypothetical protein
MPKTTTTRTKLYDAQGRHVADRLDEYTVVDKRDGRQYQMSQLRTSQAPRPRIMSRAEAGKLIVEVLNQGVPEPPTLAQIVERKKAVGLM